MKLSYLGYLLTFLATAQGASQLRGSRQADGNGSTGVYRIIKLHHMHREGDDSLHDDHQIVTSPIVDGVESHKHFDIDLPEHIINENEDLLHAGDLIIEATGSHINEEDNKVVLSENSVISVMEESRRPKRRLAISGTRTFAVIRVTMQSGETCDYSKSEIEYQLFQRPGVSLVDQMDACSGGQVKMVSAGVHELVLPGKVADYGHQAQIKDLALNTFAASKGLSQVRDFADHIMVIIPKSNFNFIGTGETGLVIINVNNQWALDLTVYMHETGHTLGVGDGRTYPNYVLDNSAIMGMAPSKPTMDGPRKCFNAPSNARLGFFSDRTKTINLQSNPTQKVSIAAFSEADKGYKADPVLLKFGEYSLQYNYVSGINSGTEKYKNEIVMGFYDGNGRVMEPTLKPNGATTEIANFFYTGKTLRVEACETVAGTSTKPNSMTVALTLGVSGSPCANAASSNLPPPVTTPAPPVTTKAPPITTPAPIVTTKAPPVTTKAPPVTTPAPPVTTPAPPATTPAPPPEGQCVSNTNIRMCRRDKDGCIWSAANGCIKLTNQVCAKLSRRQCRKTRGCSMNGNFCTLTPANSGNTQCSALTRRGCRSARSCFWRRGQCQDVQSNRDVFVPGGI